MCPPSQLFQKACKPSFLSRKKKHPTKATPAHTHQINPKHILLFLIHGLQNHSKILCIQTGSGIFYISQAYISYTGCFKLEGSLTSWIRRNHYPQGVEPESHWEWVCWSRSYVARLTIKRPVYNSQTPHCESISLWINLSGRCPSTLLYIDQVTFTKDTLTESLI